MRLRIELEDFRGIKRYTEYDNFEIGSKEEHYFLKSVGRQKGTAG